MRRIGMLTSGGDCQALNATMRGVAKSLYKKFGFKVIKTVVEKWSNEYPVDFSQDSMELK